MCKGTGAGAKVKSGGEHGFSTYQFYVREFQDHRKNKNTAKCPKSKWIYIFSVESWGVQLRCEAFSEGNDNYKLVDWKTSTWSNQDSRPATYKKVKTFSIQAPKANVDGRGLYVFLSPIQVPRKRLQKYIGNKKANPYAITLVQRHCTKLVPPKPPAKGSEKTSPESPQVDYLDAGGGKQIFLIYLNDPIELADRVAAEFAVAIRDVAKFKEEFELEYNLATAALGVLKEVLKEDDDFVSDGKFKQRAAQRIVNNYNKKNQKGQRRIENAGKRFAKVTYTSEYDESLKDYDGNTALEDESIRIKARHTANKMQSAATRAQMKMELLDPNSYISKFFTSQFLFDSNRKITAMTVQFGDLMAEYSQVMVKLRTPRALLWGTIRWAVKYRTGIDIKPFIGKHRAAALKNVYRIDVKNLATKLGGKAKPLLFGFEAINLTLAWDSFQKKKDSRQLTDYAGPLGALCDLAGQVGSRVETTLKKKEIEMAKKLGKGIYKDSVKLAVLTRVMAVIGLVGGICDMIEARTGALQAAQTLNYGQVVGHTFKYMGGAIGLHALALSWAGSSAAGPVGIIAVGLVILGILIVQYFQESELEAWLRNCKWGGDNLGKPMDKQLRELDIILAKFAPTKVRYADLKGPGFAGYTGTQLEITIQPGFVHAKSRFDIAVEVMAVTGSLGSITTQDAVEIYTSNVGVKIDAKGRAKPIKFVIDLTSQELRAKKAAGFHQNVRVKARLDLNGDKKIKIPKSGNMAWWWFNFNHSKGKFIPGNSKFE